MALRFTSAVDEHRATRRGVGFFDFSFMGWWEFAGSRARDCLEKLQTRDLASLKSGRLLYTLLLRGDGSVFVDATVWQVDRDRYWLFTGRRSDAGHIVACASDFDVDVAARHDEQAVIAVQGPASAALLDVVLPGCGASSLPFFAFRHHAIDGRGAWIARLGYTGENGFEVLLPAEIAVATWTRLAQAPFGADRRECGMEAANSLRIEAGFVHFAYELRERVRPDELGLSRLVRADEASFIGVRALRNAPAAKRRLVGVALSQARGHADEHRGGEALPRLRLTSEAYSPTFERTLALGFADADIARDAGVVTDDARVGTLCDLPFYTRLGVR